MAANQLLPMINNFEYRHTFLVNGHIMLNAPVLVRSPKLSSIEPRQYLDGRPPGNTGCCWHKSFLSHWNRLENLSNYGVSYRRGKIFLLFFAESNVTAVLLGSCMNVYTKLVGLDGPNSFGIFLSYLGSINENFSTSQKPGNKCTSWLRTYFINILETRSLYAISAV